MLNPQVKTYLGLLIRWHWRQLLLNMWARLMAQWKDGKKEVNHLKLHVDSKRHLVMMPNVLRLAGQIPSFFNLVFQNTSCWSIEFTGADRVDSLYHRPTLSSMSLQVLLGDRRGGKGGAQSIQRAATSQTHWLIYCICWAGPACLSGLRNYVLSNLHPSQTYFQQHSLEATSHGKPGDIRENNVFKAAVRACWMVQENENNVISGDTNIKRLCDSCSWGCMT